MYYSGRNCVTGVAFIVTGRLKRSVLGYNPVSDRIILIRIQGKPMNITVVQVYAPTTAADEEEKEAFYSKLEEVVEKVSSKDVLIVMGDFHAKVGEGSENEAVGRNGQEERNEAGDRLVQFCNHHQLFIANTFYELPKRRLYTWTSPDNNTRNQIDYILCKTRWKNAVTAANTLPGADCGTDHELLMSRLRFRLRVTKRGARPIRYDTENIPEVYSVEVKNRFTALTLEEKEPDQVWNEIKAVITEKAKMHVPLRPRQNKSPWLSAKALDIAAQRRAAKRVKDRAQFRSLQAQFQRKARQDKREFLEHKCEELEKKNRVGKTRDMFKTIREITGVFKPRVNVLMGKEGNDLNEEAEIKGRWKEYTQELYRKDSKFANELCDEDLPGQEPPVLKSEVEQAIRLLANNKAPGADGIPIELIKQLGTAGAEVMYSLCQMIWSTGKWPSQWKQSIYIPIFKKGDQKLCTNYRTIALIPHASKILLKIMQKRLERKMEDILPEEQAGFRKSRGTRDHIANLRWLMESMREYQQDVYMCFIDYTKAFDSVDHDTLWAVLLKLGVQPHLIRLMRNLYKNQEAAVRTEHGDTDWFGVEKGVRQGRILSPYLFNLYAEYVMREAGLQECTQGVRIGGRVVNNLRYADDTTLLECSVHDLSNIIGSLKEASERLGLKLNMKKTKIMSTTNLQEFSLDREKIEVVKSFVFLGASVKYDGTCEGEIRRRILLGRQAMDRLTPIMKSKDTPMNLKVRLIQAIVFPTTLYGCESWTMRKADERRIQAFEMWCWRRALRIPWTEKVSNDLVLIWANPGKRSLLNKIKKQQLAYFGHVMRGEGMEKMLMLGKVEGKRRRGRQRMRWMDGIQKAAEMDLREIRDVVGKRSEWRGHINRVTRGRQRPDGP